MLMNQKEDIEAEIKRMKKEKTNKIENLSGAKTYRGVRNKQEEILRKGLFGKVGNVLFGPKVLNSQEEYVDRSEVEYAEKKTKELEKNLSIEVDQRKREINNLIDKMVDIGDIDYELESKQFEEKLARENYKSSIENIEEQKYKLKNHIVKVSKDNYIKSLKNSCETYTKISKKFLDDKKDIITLILNESLEIERDEINKLKKGVDQITTLSNKTPKELESEIKSSYERMEIIDKNIEYLNEIKEGE